MSATSTVGRFEIGRVLQNTASVLHHNFGPFLGASLLLIGVPSFLMLIAQTWLVTDDAAIEANLARALAGIGVFLGAWLLYLVTSTLLQAAVIHGTVADLNRGRASFGEMLSAALRRVFPLLGFALLYALALASGGFVIGLLAVLAGPSMPLVVGIGFLVWAVPAILMFLAWVVGTPAMMVEGLGPIKAFGRSAQLTRGFRWKIFLLLLCWFGIYLVLALAFGAVRLLLNFTLGEGPIATGLTEALIYVLAGMVSSAGVASVYYELRQIKEGVAPKDLAAIFD